MLLPAQFSNVTRGEVVSDLCVLVYCVSKQAGVR